MAQVYIVKKGECLASIAFANGFFWPTLWNHDQNAALRQKRDHPHILLPGDEVFVPDLQAKEASCATGRSHTFRRKGVPERLHLRFMTEDEPRAGVPYLLVIDGTEHEGALDASGALDHFLSPDARLATLVLRPKDAPEEHYRLALRCLHPITELTGVRGRLRNLGLYSGPLEGELDEPTRAALRTFQSRAQLPVTGEPDDATRAALVEAQGR
jgi:putative peptidoglycan binding protein